MGNFIKKQFKRSWQVTDLITNKYRHNRRIVSPSEVFDNPKIRIKHGRLGKTMKRTNLTDYMK